MEERKIVLSSERVATRIAEIKEDRYIRYYDIFAVIAGVLSFLLLFRIIFIHEDSYMYKYHDFSYFIDDQGFLVYTLSSLVSSIIFSLFFRNIHVKAKDSLKELKEEIKNQENIQNTNNK